MAREVRSDDKARTSSSEDSVSERRITAVVLSRPSRGGVIVVLAVLGWVLFVHGIVMFPNHTDALAPNKIAVSGYGPEVLSAGPTEAAASDLAAVKSAAHKYPDDTAQLSTSYQNTKTKGEVGLQIEVLPNDSIAKTAETEARSYFLGTDYLKTVKFTRTKVFSIAGVPGSQAATFVEPSGTSTGNEDGVVFRVGRVVIDESVVSPVDLSSITSEVARAEYQHIVPLVPVLVVSADQRSIVASIVYFLVALVILALVCFLPESIETGRRRQQERQAAAARRHYQTRGSKVLRQQRARGLR